MIQIDIKMPKSCIDCPCCACDDDGHSYWCQALLCKDGNLYCFENDDFALKRDKNCPIIGTLNDFLDWYNNPFNDSLLQSNIEVENKYKKEKEENK